MFEAKPPRPDDGRPLSTEGLEGHALRELTWADLVSRLSASRSLRGEFDSPVGESEASFDATNARRVAAHHSCDLSVNLEHSSYRKEAQRTGFPSVKGAGAAQTPGAARK